MADSDNDYDSDEENIQALKKKADIAKRRYELNMRKDDDSDDEPEEGGRRRRRRTRRRRSSRRRR